MSFPIRSFATVAIASAILGSTAPAVTLFQRDDFSGGTANWVEGGPSPNPPTIADSGLPGGPYLLNASAGGGAGSRQVMWNDAQWGGDYLAAGITGITFDAASDGSDPLALRLGFYGPGGWFVTTPLAIADLGGAGDRLTGYAVGITALDLTHVAGGSGIYTDTLSAVSRLEIFSAAGAPATGNTPSVLRGDVSDSILLIDNLTAVPEPGPAALLALSLVTCAGRRRH